MSEALRRLKATVENDQESELDQLKKTVKDLGTSHAELRGIIIDVLDQQSKEMEKINTRLDILSVSGPQIHVGDKTDMGQDNTFDRTNVKGEQKTNGG